MDRRTLHVVALAGVAIVAVAVAASTLTATVDPGGSPGIGGDGAMFNLSDQTDDPPEAPIAIPYLEQLVVLAILAMLVGTVLYAVTNRRRAALIAMALVGLTVILFALAEFLTLPGQTPQDSAFGLMEDTGVTGTGGEEGFVDIPQWAVFVLAAAVVGGLILSMTLAANRTDEDAVNESDSDNGEDERVADEIASVAATAADRLEDEASTTGFDNEIFRAWHQMTVHLDVARPTSHTAQEFARAAIDAGMARRDVKALTELFEEVRYGTTPVSERREREAVELFRRIEAQYGDEST